MLLGMRPRHAQGGALRRIEGRRQSRGPRDPCEPFSGADTTKTDEERWLPIPAALWPFVDHALATFPGPYLFPDKHGDPHKPAIKLEQQLRSALANAGIVDGYVHTCRRCHARGKEHSEKHSDADRRRCPSCGMILWASPVKVRMKFHELWHSTNTLLAALGVPENVRADILGHRTRAMTRRYTHLTVQQMREGFRKLDAARPINVAPGAPIASAAYRGVAARAEVIVRALPANSGEDAPLQPDAGECSGATDPGLTASRRANRKPRTPPKNRLSPGPSMIEAEHRVRTGDLRLGKADRPSHQRSPLFTNHHQISEIIQAPLHRRRRRITNDPQPSTAFVFHRCSRTARARSMYGRQRSCSVGVAMPSETRAKEVNCATPATI